MVVNAYSLFGSQQESIFKHLCYVLTWWVPPADNKPMTNNNGIQILVYQIRRVNYLVYDIRN